MQHKYNFKNKNLHYNYKTTFYYLICNTIYYFQWKINRNSNTKTFKSTSSTEKEQGFITIGHVIVEMIK